MFLAVVTDSLSWCRQAVLIVSLGFENRLSCSALSDLYTSFIAGVKRGGGNGLVSCLN